jgi:hypothetical protein
MPHHTFLSPEHLRMANEILQWAKDYLMTEHAQMKRPGGTQVVCPFVAASMENDSFYMEFHSEVNGLSEETIEELMLAHITPFKNLSPSKPIDKLKKTLLVIFPEIPPEETHVLDIVHANIKHKFVEAGLMVGQFHQNCDERSVHNEAFRVSISPHPLIAIRHMATHDILFLKDDPQYFKAYNVRYGDKFNQPDKLEDYNRPFLPLFLEAKRRFLR